MSIVVTLMDEHSCAHTRDTPCMAVRAMNARIRGGPDDEGLHVDWDAGMPIGARRLRIIDGQPPADERRSVFPLRCWYKTTMVAA